MGHARDLNLIKIKVSAPKFSGKSRDFAVFKRDFKSIGVVEGRNAIEVGALLKESIPSEYKYLLNNFELSEHDLMMECLTQKFGRARIIVDECTAELKHMKKLHNDSEFIKFVNHLDKMKRDLSHLGLLADVANTTVISEIESKLPNMVQRDWIKLVSSKDISDKPSCQIFEKLLEFLEDTKRQAEYFGTDVRQCQGNQVKESMQLNFVNCEVSDLSVSDCVSYKFKEPPRHRYPLPCLACGDSSDDHIAASHPTNKCDIWRRLTFQQKRERVKCLYHPAKGLNSDHTTEECKVGSAKCYKCKSNNRNGHHTWFCNQDTDTAELEHH